MLRTPALVRVRPIRDSHELDAVYRLTHDAYVSRGYSLPRPDGRLVHYPHLDGISETTVLVAVCDDEIVGTNSFTLDGPAGLHTDSDFHAECEELRAEGRRLAASWRVATLSRCRTQREVVMALIQATVWLACDCGVQTSVFTFNPLHAPIYERLLNMREVARSAGTGGLRSAPAVLMRLDREEVPPSFMADFQPGRYFRPTIVQVAAAQA